MIIVIQDGNTPLHNAAAYGHLDTVKLLVQKGASLKKDNKVSHSLFNTPSTVLSNYDNYRRN